MKYGQSKLEPLKKLLTLAAALMIIPTAGFLIKGYLPVLENIFENAAVLSVAFTMPEGGTKYLSDRFNGDVLDKVPEPKTYMPLPDIVPPEDTHAPPDERENGYVRPPKSERSATPPEIEQEYRGTIVTEDMSADMTNAVFQNVGIGYLRNYTSLENGEIKEILKTPSDIRVDGSDGPQVLIFHTHATESYELYDTDFYDIRGTWRSTDESDNMIAVGDVLQEVLEAEGISVLHDTTLHDYPSYNGSYERSAATVSEYLEEYPSIKVVLDLHRDGIEREGNIIVKPTVEIEGRKTAQLMIISACDADGSLGVPEWRSNLRFAAALTNAAEQDYPGLMRPIFFANRKYNMNLSPGALLLEFGTQANTLEEAMNTAEFAGRSLARLLKQSED